jgi:signal transduction histidine kinase
LDGTLKQRLSNQASMISIVAHDLRHPLFLLTLASELASTNGEDGMAFVRTLEMIQKTLPMMRRLIDDLEDYGSMQAGNLRLDCKPVAPSVIVETALALFAPLAESRDIDLSANVEDSLPDALVDRDRIVQVVSNLLANALCLSPVGGSVVVAVHLEDNHAQFAVSDSGPGIKPDDLPKLFDRYWRGNHGCYAGRGLGLAIARALVEAHCGRIWADNERTRGARISFTIPVVGHPKRIAHLTSHQWPARPAAAGSR